MANRKPHDFKANNNPENRPKVINLDNKLVKTKKLGGGLTMKILQNDVSGRIFVEFISGDGRLTLQKSFQNNLEGNKASLEFQERFTDLKALRKYFGLDKF